MKLGLLTAAFPETPLDEVADWSAANGFEMLEVACWPRTEGPSRRYAGVSHIDCANLSDDQAKDFVGDLAGGASRSPASATTRTRSTPTSTTGPRWSPTCATSSPPPRSSACPS